MTRGWVVGVGSLLALLAISHVALAQDCSSPPNTGWKTDYASFAAWCTACGGTPYNTNGIGCTPGPNWGRTGGSQGSGAALGGQLAMQAAGLLGQALHNWLFGNPQQEARQRAMMEELQRRRLEAERQHNEEEARRLSEMCARLMGTLKLIGLPHLQLKGSGSAAGGLQLKRLSDSADDHVGIKQLPGIALNDDTGNGGNTPYGIKGLPGVYVNGPGPDSGLSQPKLQLKRISDSTEPGQQAPATPTPETERVPAGIAPDPNTMTAEQAADLLSKLSPQDQERVLGQTAGAPAVGVPAQGQQPSAPAQSGAGGAGGQNAPAPGQPPLQMRQHADASQAAATATSLEDASARARTGFETSTAPVVDLRHLPVGEPTTAKPGAGAGNNETGPTGSTAPRLSTSQPPPPPWSAGQNTGSASSWTPHAAPSPSSFSVSSASGSDLLLLFPASPGKLPEDDLIRTFLFPGQKSVSPFPTNPDRPLVNPLRTEADLQAELKRWDDWAVQRTIHVADGNGTVVGDELNRGVIQQYAPDLLGRFKADAAFHTDMVVRLNMAAQLAAIDYYQGLADGHKAAILTYQRGIEELQKKDVLSIGVPLEEQFITHPERQGMVQAIRDRAAAVETQSVQQAEATGHRRLDEEYRRVFDIVRAEAAQNPREK